MVYSLRQKTHQPTDEWADGQTDGQWLLYMEHPQTNAGLKTKFIRLPKFSSILQSLPVMSFRGNLINEFKALKKKENHIISFLFSLNLGKDVVVKHHDAPSKSTFIQNMRIIT